MTDLVVETPEGLSLRFEIAGAGSRSAAALVDAVLWASVLFAGFFFFEVLLGGMGGFGVWIGAGMILSLVSYHALFGVLWQGTTPGKRLMGLAVFDENGLGATPLQHVLRSIFWPIEALLLVPVPIGIVMMAATPQHQRLGDRVAGTLVLRRHRPRRQADPLRRVTWSQLPKRRLMLVPAHASSFDGDDLVFLAELLGRVGVEPRVRAVLLRRAVVHYAGRLEFDPEPYLVSRDDARTFLSELYLFLREIRGRAVEGR